MIANYVCTLVQKTHKMGTWEKVVFGVVFFFSVGAAAVAERRAEPLCRRDANDRAGYNSWAKRFKQ